MRCYSRAKAMVDAGSTTWDYLVGLGLALSLTDEKIDPFTAALKKAEGK